MLKNGCRQDEDGIMKEEEHTAEVIVKLKNQQLATAEASIKLTSTGVKVKIRNSDGRLDSEQIDARFCDSMATLMK